MSAMIRADDISTSEAIATCEPAGAVLVTGGAGFIGSATVRALLRRGDSVVILDELNDYYDQFENGTIAAKVDNVKAIIDEFGTSHLSIYYGDICDAELLARVFSEERIESVVHLAARAGVRKSIEDPLDYCHANVRGTITLLEAVRKYAPDLTNFVYASSSSVYGGNKKVPFAETDAVDHPVSPYAATKKATEVLVHSWHHLYNIPCSGLRFFTVYGPGGRVDMAPFKFIHMVANQLPLTRYGDGSTSRDYTYVDDIVSGVVLSLDNPRPYELYNLGNGKPCTLNKFIATIEKVMGKKAHIKQLPMQPGDVPITFADITKARTLLGYDPQVSLEEGLRRTAEWYLEVRTPPAPLGSTAVPTLSMSGALLRNLRQVLKRPLPAHVDSSLLVCTRVHCQNSDTTRVLSPEQRVRLTAWIANALSFAGHVAIAVDATEGMALVNAVRSILDGPHDHVTVVPVAPWGAFTPALNACLTHAASLSDVRSILFQSTEVLASRDTVETLTRTLRASDRTLVVGARLDAAQTFPWNTFAMWDVKKLSRTGFLSVSDGGAAGVEEASLIGLQQKVFGEETNQALLVRIPEMEMAWDVNFEDSERAAWHRRKMESKVTRATAHLAELDLQPSDCVVRECRTILSSSDACSYSNSRSLALPSLPCIAPAQVAAGG